MNVQQSKQAKITLMAMVLMFAAALACMPQIAFAEEAQAQGAVDVTQSEEQLQSATALVGAQALEVQQTAKPSATQAAVDANVAKAEEPNQVSAGNGAPLEAQAANAEQGGVLEAQAQELSAQASPNVAGVSLTYDTHVQNIGWQNPVHEGEVSGTEGHALRLEGIHISLTGMDGIKGSIVYRTHVQNDGWQDPVRNGAMSGTEGRALRLEGIKIWLEGDIAKHYDVFYRTHVQNDGWQGWQKNGDLAGTTGRALRLEGIEIKLSAKTQAAMGESAANPSLRYEAHAQNVGWQEWVSGGEVAGTTGQSLRVEALNIVLSGGPYAGGIAYEAHVQNIGWQGARVDGDIAGTTGDGLRLEAIRIWLTGKVVDHYDVYYCAHVQNYGWLDWASNGGEAGSTGLSLRVEAIRIQLVEKNGPAPGATENPIVVITELDGIDISGWQRGINLYNVAADFVIVKATGGIGFTNDISKGDPLLWRRMADDVLGSGKLLGLYHFARERGYRGSARAEADFFVDNVSDYVGKAILVLDYEDDAINQGPGWAETWLDRVYERTGVRPMIYMSKSVTTEQDWSSVASKYELWGAQYLYRYYNHPQTGFVDDPELTNGWGAWGKPTIYQYNTQSYLEGWGSNLDMNKFYGSVVDWRKLAAKS